MKKFKHHIQFTNHIFDLLPEFGCRDDLLGATFRHRNDWAFIVTYHAALESILNLLLIKRMGWAYEKTLRLPMNGRRSKMNKIAKERMLPKYVCEMISCISFLRNHLAHNLNMLDIKFKNNTDEVVDCFLENIYSIYSVEFVSNYIYDFYKFKKHFQHEMQVLLMLIVEVSGVTILSDGKIAEEYLEYFFEGYYWKKDWLTDWCMLS
jgi:hypothetical protein